jgi:hypothetical protein
MTKTLKTKAPGARKETTVSFVVPFRTLVVISLVLLLFFFKRSLFRLFRTTDQTSHDHRGTAGAASGLDQAVALHLVVGDSRVIRAAIPAHCVLADFGTWDRHKVFIQEEASEEPAWYGTRELDCVRSGCDLSTSSFFGGSGSATRVLVLLSLEHIVE